jgi:Tfp pilus assembly protein PilE
MALDHEAIYKAYAGTVVSIDDSAGAFDASGNSVSLDQTKINEARATLDAEAAAILYQSQRTGAAGTTDTIYPSIGDQLDALYKDIVAGTVTTSGAFATAIKATKDKYPKP